MRTSLRHLFVYFTHISDIWKYLILPLGPSLFPKSRRTVLGKIGKSSVGDGDGLLSLDRTVGCSRHDSIKGSGPWLSPSLGRLFLSYCLVSPRVPLWDSFCLSFHSFLTLHVLLTFYFVCVWGSRSGDSSSLSLFFWVCACVCVCGIVYGCFCCRICRVEEVS